jgi:hypothetical protein
MRAKKRRPVPTLTRKRKGGNPMSVHDDVVVPQKSGRE